MFLLDFSPVVFTILLIAGVPLATFALRQACSLCRSDIPSYRRAFLTVLIITPIVLLAVDFSAYITLRALNGYGVRVPEGYGYADWFDEPWGLKLAALERAPFFRYAPVIFGLCVAGALQVLALEIHFRTAVLIFVIQWAGTVLALTVIVFILSLGGLPVPSFEMPEPPDEPEAKPGMPEPKDKAEPADEVDAIKKKITMIAPQIDKNGEPILPGQEAKSTASSKTATDTKGAADPPDQPKPKARSRNYRLPGKKSAYFLDILREDCDPYLVSLKSASESFTESLPTPIQDFFNKGGWWAFIALLAAGSGLWIWSFARRIQEEFLAPAVKQKVMRNSTDQLVDIDLMSLPPPPPARSRERILIKGIPVRVRLILLAPAGKDILQMRPEIADQLLDWIRPGLSQIAAWDAPRVLIGGRQYSLDGFQRAFHHHMRVPESPRQKSRWILVAGSVSVGRLKVHLGLVLLADIPSIVRHITVNEAEWLEALVIGSSR